MFPGAFYHVATRGNEQKAVFKGKRDREQLLEYLETATERYSAVTHAFCLMDSHYHLLLETPAGNLSQIMHHINGAYTTYYNVKRARSDHLVPGSEGDPGAKGCVCQRATMLKYEKSVMEMVDQEYESPLGDVVGSVLPGNPEFVDFIKKIFISNREPDRNLPVLRQLAPRVSMPSIFSQIDVAFPDSSRESSHENRGSRSA